MDLDHLFRHESGKLIAALTRVFGMHNLALAEDVVQEALCRALDVWKVRGVPDNPSAWLMATAKRCAIDVHRREPTTRTFAPELARSVATEQALEPALGELLGPAALKDDQLRMMFSCCHPRLPEEAQVALILHILCGFSIPEVAAAFLTAEEAIKKRILRAKATLADSSRLFELTDTDLPARLSAVQRALYLLFNEGYHGASPEQAVRVELCEEAMRLVAWLCQNPVGATPPTHALAALMCLHAARLPARTDDAGDLTLLLDQDRSLWDQTLISDGMRLMDLAATGSELTAYHVEAAIAAAHAGASRIEDTPWDAIVSLYDTLLSVRPSPVVALNRALAVAQRDGPERGLAELAAITDRDRLVDYPFYYAALGELELRRGRPKVARAHFATALALARNPTERRFLERRMSECAV
jgi:RNA polymerase sigma-70 factor (ECF subfamily)